MNLAEINRRLLCYVVLAIMTVLPSVQAVASDKQTAGQRPNILLIVADDLGYSDIGAYGGEIDTPNLDMLAAEGKVLTNFRVTTACSPTRAQLLSGTDHHLVGLGTMAENLWTSEKQQGQPGYEGVLNERALSFPQLLKDHGYRTYMVGKWHLGFEEPDRPGKKGFERSFALLDGAASHFTMDGAFVVPGSGATTMPKARYSEDDKPLDRLPDDFFSSDSFTDRMLEYLRDHAQTTADRPFFAFVSYTAPHWPLQAPKEYIDKYKGQYDQGYEALREARIAQLRERGLLPKDLASAELDLGAEWEALSSEDRKLEARRMEVYAAMVDNMDVNIGRLIDQLKKTGAYENTFIMFISDNGPDGTTGGELFGPTFELHDNSYENMGTASSYVMYGPHWAAVSATPFRGTKTMTSEGGISSPAIIRAPQQSVGDGQILRQSLTVMDVAPTILGLAGIENPGTSYKGREVEPILGRSFLPLLSGSDKALHGDDQAFGWELFSRRAIIKGDWKLLWIEPPHGIGSWELYNIRKDRAEQNNLAAEHPEKLQELIAEWEDYVESVGVVMDDYPWPAFIQ